MKKERRYSRGRCSATLLHINILRNLSPFYLLGLFRSYSFKYIKSSSISIRFLLKTRHSMWFQTLDWLPEGFSGNIYFRLPGVDYTGEFLFYRIFIHTILKEVKYILLYCLCNFSGEASHWIPKTGGIAPSYFNTIYWTENHQYKDIQIADHHQYKDIYIPDDYQYKDIHITENYQDRLFI